MKVLSSVQIDLVAGGALSLTNLAASLQNAAKTLANLVNTTLQTGTLSLTGQNTFKLGTISYAGGTFTLINNGKTQTITVPKFSISIFN